MEPPELDRLVGMEVYLSTSPGIGGGIRRRLEDFVVEEILVDGSRATVSPPEDVEVGGDGSHLVCLLVKRGWDTLLIVREIAGRLGVDPKVVKTAGIKDARAVTAQHISIRGITPRQILEIRIRNAHLKPLRYSRTPISTGMLLGNAFQVTIREIEIPELDVKDRINRILAELNLAGGLPNFFAYQRFGTVRPVTHVIGGHIIRGEYEEAVYALLTRDSPHEHPAAREARRRLRETMDYAEALRLFPPHLKYERAALKRLARNPRDFIGALKQLPPRLLRLFTHAYQSYLFNRFLSGRIKQIEAPHTPNPGDYLVEVDGHGLPTGRYITVTESNLREASELVKRGSARVALPLIGFRQNPSLGRQGELEAEILEEEGIKPGDFKLKEFPEASARGSLRAAFTIIKDFAVRSVDVDPQGRASATLSFTLLRGTYATTLLREIMKPKNPVDAGF